MMKYVGVFLVLSFLAVSVCGTELNNNYGWSISTDYLQSSLFGLPNVTGHVSGTVKASLTGINSALCTTYSTYQNDAYILFINLTFSSCGGNNLAIWSDDYWYLNVFVPEDTVYNYTASTYLGSMLFIKGGTGVTAGNISCVNATYCVFSSRHDVTASTLGGICAHTANLPQGVAYLEMFKSHHDGGVYYPYTNESFFDNANLDQPLRYNMRLNPTVMDEFWLKAYTNINSSMRRNDSIPTNPLIEYVSYTYSDGRCSGTTTTTLPGGNRLNCSIQGTVVDSNYMNFLPNVSVSLFNYAINQHYSTNTNNLGHFSIFSSIAPLDTGYELSLSKPGYSSITKVLGYDNLVGLCSYNGYTNDDYYYLNVSGSNNIINGSNVNNISGLFDYCVDFYTSSGGVKTFLNNVGLNFTIVHQYDNSFFVVGTYNSSICFPDTFGNDYKITARLANYQPFTVYGKLHDMTDGSNEERLVPYVGTGNNTFCINGTVRKPDNSPFPGVNIEEYNCRSNTNMTRSDGGFSFCGLYGDECNFLIRKSGYAFYKFSGNAWDNIFNITLTNISSNPSSSSSSSSSIIVNPTVPGSSRGYIVISVVLNNTPVSGVSCKIYQNGNVVGQFVSGVSSYEGFLADNTQQYRISCLYNGSYYYADVFSGWDVENVPHVFVELLGYGNPSEDTGGESFTDFLDSIKYFGEAIILFFLIKLMTDFAGRDD